MITVGSTSALCVVQGGCVRGVHIREGAMRRCSVGKTETCCCHSRGILCISVSARRALGFFLSPHPRTSSLHTVEDCLLCPEFVSSPNSFVKTLIPNVMAFEVGALGIPPGGIILVRGWERAGWLPLLSAGGGAWRRRPSANSAGLPGGQVCRHLGLDSPAFRAEEEVLAV